MVESSTFQGLFVGEEQNHKEYLMAEVTYPMYIVGPAAFHDEPVEFSLVAARKLQRRLQKIEEDEASDDAPPEEIKIFKVEEVR